MHIHTIQKTSFSATLVTRIGERLTTSALSIMVPSLHTVSDYTMRLIYTEALLSGSGSLSREAFMDAQNKLGATIAVASDASYIHISVQSIDTVLSKTLVLVKTMLLKPRFEASEIKRIKEHLKNTLILAKEDARPRAYQGFVATILSKNDSRYLYPIDEIQKTVDKVTVNDLKAFHKKVMGHSWSLTTGGSTESNELILKTLEKICLGEKKIATLATKEPEASVVPGRTVKLVDIPQKQNIEFSIGNVLPLTRASEDFSAFVFGINVLAIYGGFTGRLMSIVREKEGLTYMIYGSVEKATKTDAGFWRIATFFNPKDAVQGITSTLREIERIHRDGITEDELKRFKAIMKTRYALIEDSLLKKIREAHSLTLSGISEEDFKIFKDEIQHMTTRQVNNALKKYLKADSLVISGAGPVASVRKALEKFAKQK